MNELIYDWKTGSLLDTDRNPWRNDGFTLHLTIACSEKPRAAAPPSTTSA